MVRRFFRSRVAKCDKTSLRLESNIYVEQQDAASRLQPAFQFVERHDSISGWFAGCRSSRRKDSPNRRWKGNRDAVLTSLCSRNKLTSNCVWLRPAARFEDLDNTFLGRQVFAVCLKQIFLGATKSGEHKTFWGELPQVFTDLVWLQTSRILRRRQILVPAVNWGELADAYFQNLFISPINSKTDALGTPHAHV